MNPILAENVLLQFFKDGDYRDFACLTDCSIETTTEVKDVRTIGNGVWKKKRGQSLAYIINCSGIIELEELQPVSFWLLNFQHQLLHVQWRMLFEQPETGLIKILTGEALVESSVFAAAATGFASSDFRMQGHGAYTVQDSATSCNATIGELSWGTGEEPGQIIVNYTGLVNAARLEYSIDGGAREVIFDPGANGFITINGLSEGSHTITFWAVCESGVDGEENSFTLEIGSGGEPGPACAAPGTPVVSDITGTTATASWPAASPVPAGGYSWELVNTVSSDVVDSGSTTGLSVNFTGLTNGVEYLFRVRSICEAGVSESSFMSTTFTAEGETCARPGPLTIIYNQDGEIAVTYTASPSAPADGYYAEIVDSLGNVTPIGYTMDLQTGTEGLTNGETYVINVYAVCSATDMSSARSLSFVSGGSSVCNVPGSPVISDITTTTATATWTAPSPAPADGYAWEVLDGVTVIDSGTTPLLSVDLTGLPPGTALTFRVKALCEEGVNESGYNSTPFETEGGSQIFWNFNEDLGNGSLVIRRNGIIVVNAAAAGAGNFTAAEDNVIQITLTATTGNITVTDDTASIEIINEDGSGSFNESFTVVDGHDYTINATVTS